MFDKLKPQQTEMNFRICHSGFHLLKLILLIGHFVTFAQLEVPTVQLQNWIQTTTGKWPQSEGKNESFYFYRGEYLNQAAFGINKDLLSDTQLATGTLDYSFKYWTDTNDNRFRSITGTNNVKEAQLNSVNRWTKSSVTKLTREEWNNFKFLNQNPFTVALKDVLVQFLERVDSDKLVKSDIHGYKSAPEHSANIKDNGDSYTILPTPKDSKDASYINLLETEPENKDRCYQISFTPESHPIEVYFTFEGLSSGISLVKINSKSEKFCISDYIALRNIGKFQLTFVINGPIEKDTKLEVTKIDEDFRDLEALISVPGDEGADITVGWYYYNEIYDYSINGPKNQKIWACDVVSNCYPYEVLGDLDDKTQKYVIRDDSKILLAKSPFIRILMDDKRVIEKIEFSEKSESYAMGLFRKQYLVQNSHPGSTVSGTTSFTNDQTEGERFSIANFKLDSNKKSIVKIPLSQIDFRVHQLIVDLKIPQNAKPIQLVNLEYKNGLKVSNFPSSIQNKKLEFNSWRFSTQDYFISQPTELQSRLSDRSIELTFESTNEATMEIIFELQKSTLIQIDEYSAEPGKNSGNLKHRSSTGEKLPVDSLTLVELKDSKHGLFITDWIRAGEEPIVRDDDLVQFSISRKKAFNEDTGKLIAGNKDSNLKLSDVKVTRIIITRDNINYTEINNQISEDGTILINDIQFQKEQVRGSFKIGYLFVSKSNEDMEIRINLFKIKSQSSTCAIKGSSLMGTNCKYEKSVCPHSFVESSNQCKLNHIYRFVEKRCDPAVPGCSSIFYPILATSSIYATSQDNSRYVPHQTSVLTNITHHYIKVDSPKARNQNEDFCIQFDYSSKLSHLLINSNSDTTQHYNIEYPPTELIHSKNEPVSKNQKVCASYLSPNVEIVRAIYFRFAEAPIIETDDYYVKNMKFVEPKSKRREILNGIELDHILESQFLDSYDKTEWTFTSKALSFSISDLDLWKQAHGNHFVSYLRTKWLEVPNVLNFQDKFLLGIKLLSENLSKTLIPYKILFEVNSPEKLLISKSIEQLRSDLVNSLEMPTNSISHYQLTIKVMLDLSNVDFKKPENEKSFHFTLESLTINDPCMDADKNQMVSCNGHATTCTRRYDTFSPKCDCLDGFIGNYCENDDFCKKINPETKRTNDQFCPTQAQCRNDWNVGRFHCDCGKDRDWNYETKSCVNKSTPTPVPTPIPTSVPKDPIIALVAATIAKAEKDLKTYDELRQVQIEAELTKLKDILKRYEQKPGGQDELIAELTVHETRLRHLLA